MDRRQFVGVIGALAAVPVAAGAAVTGEEAAIRQRVKDLYKAFSTGDLAGYRAAMTADYIFIEDGSITDLEGDIAEFGKRPRDFRRTDSFDFRQISVSGDMAYAVYYLNAHESGTGFPPRDPRWLETMVLRRQGGDWKCTLIHSSRLDTLIVTPVPPTGA